MPLEIARVPGPPPDPELSRTLRVTFNEVFILTSTQDQTRVASVAFLSPSSGTLRELRWVQPPLTEEKQRPQRRRGSSNSPCGGRCKGRAQSPVLFLLTDLCQDPKHTSPGCLWLASCRQGGTRHGTGFSHSRTEALDLQPRGRGPGEAA